MSRILEKSAYVSIIFIGLVVFFLILKEFANFLRPFVIALILSFLIVPVARISKEKKVLLFLNTLSVIIIAAVFISLITTLFISESNSYNTNSNLSNPSTLNSIFKNSALLNYEFKIGDKEYKLVDLMKTGQLVSIFHSAFNVLVSSIVSFLSEFFLVLLFLGFILPSHDRIMRKIESKMHKNESIKAFRETLKEIEESIRAYLGIKSLISGLTGILSGLVIYLFGIPYVVIFSLLIFLLNFIPNIGSIVAVGIVLLFSVNILGFGFKFIMLAFFLILIQIILGNIIEPKINGKKFELSPIIILLSLFFWGYIWGIIGMFFAVPLTVIIKIILQNIKETKKFIEFFM
jgi:predicted PurR-regulated permease PerM